MTLALTDRLAPEIRVVPVDGDHRGVRVKEPLEQVLCDADNKWKRDLAA